MIAIACDYVGKSKAIQFELIFLSRDKMVCGLLRKPELYEIRNLHTTAFYYH
jgi:hypothetical protein